MKTPAPAENTEATPAAHDLLEREAVECLGTTSEVTLYLSAAISLKRIADTLEKMRTAPVNEYGETFAESIYGGIARGMRDGRP